MSSSSANSACTIPSSATATAHLVERSFPIPAAGPRQVLVRLTAASLNYRDILVAKRSPEYPGIGGLPGNHKPDLIPCSDGAGIIHTVGPESKWAGREGLSVILHPNEWLSGDVRNLDLTKVFGAADFDGKTQTLSSFCYV